MTRSLAVALAALAVVVLAGPAAGQQAGLYVPKKTAWGDPDFRGTWPVEQINPAGIPLERPVAFGDRLLLTDDEFAERLEAAKRSDEGYRNEVGADGTVGLAEWLQATPFGRRTSQIVDPANGRLPPMTPEGEALFRAGRNSWIDGQAIDWVTDLDAYDRCLPRGFPASMLPWPGGNGIRVFQSPGFVVLQLEILGTRIVPLGSAPPWAEAVHSWFGQSRGHWDGDTLVIETANIVAGDSASRDVWQRASSPLPGRGKGTIPMSAQAQTVERLTMTGPDTIAYAVTYSDPEVFTAPWTVELEWTRDSSYRLHEYACHEGNVAIRDMITASRAQRQIDAAADGAGGDGK